MERIQRSATRIILLDVTYEERLAHLSIPVLNDFIFECCEVHFNKISKDVNHSLYSRIVFDNLGISSREKNVSSRFRPVITCTQKRARSFFSFLCDFLTTEIFTQSSSSFNIQSINHFLIEWQEMKSINKLRKSKTKLVTEVTYSWQRWLTLDRGDLLLTEVTYSWQRWITCDRGDLLLTEVTYLWQRWLTCDRGDLLVTEVTYLWQRWPRSSIGWRRAEDDSPWVMNITVGFSCCNACWKIPEQ